jgi:hypothetical protein
MRVHGAPPASQPPAPHVDPTALKEIASGVYVITDRRVRLVPNIGIIFGSGSALVVDTGMGPVKGQKVLGCAKKLAGGRPLILTLTHFHPEHGFGAQVFKGSCRVTAISQLVRAGMDRLRDPVLFDAELRGRALAIARRARNSQPIRHRPVGGDAVRHRISQDDLCEIELAVTEKDVALIDQVENRTDDQGHKQRTPRNAIRYAVPANLKKLQRITSIDESDRRAQWLTDLTARF